MVPTPFNRLLALPIERPLATAMFFSALFLLGLIAVSRMSIALFPTLTGDSLTVQFYRQGADAAFLEREILIPLRSRIGSVADITETRSFIQGSSGRINISFETGTDIEVREYELQKIASKLQREQPQNTTTIRVDSQSTGAFDTFVMTVSVMAEGLEKDELYDMAVRLIAPRLAAVPGVSSAETRGGGRKQVTVTIDPAKASNLGVTSSQIENAVGKRLGQISHLGKLDSEEGITDVLIDGRLDSMNDLGQTQINPRSPLKIEHVTDIEMGYGQFETLYQVNGKSAVGVSIYQDDDANLVSVGTQLRERVTELREEMAWRGIDLVILNDASEMVDDRISDLVRMASLGFLLAFVVLYVFLRQWRAVAVVAISVPISIVLALALLYLLGYNINILTLSGLAISVGLLVDNSVVVYEAILRGIEKGIPPSEATKAGLRRTVRAIMAASLTTAIVFLPITFVDLGITFVEQMIKVFAVAFLLPIGTSLLVAVGLVPLLAHRLAAPAAQQRVDKAREDRERRSGVHEPNSTNILLGGLSKLSLRHPQSWLTGVAFFVIVTLFFFPALFSGGNQEAQNADSVELAPVFDRGARNMEAVKRTITQVDEALLEIEGVESVVSQVDQEGGTITVNFVDIDERPEGLTVNAVRGKAREISERLRGVDILRPGEANYYQSRQQEQNRGGGWNNSEPEAIILTGPSGEELMEVGERIVNQLESIDVVDRSWLAVRPANRELWITPIDSVMESLGLFRSHVLPALNYAGVEGRSQAGRFSLDDGREIPVSVEREGAREQEASVAELRKVPIYTPSGALQLNQVAQTVRMPPGTTIVYENGRREIRVFFQYVSDVAESEGDRESAFEQIREIVQNVPKPGDLGVEFPDESETMSLAAKLTIPIILMLYLVLAMTFESISMPFLVFVAIPLTILGAVWTLLLAGMGGDPSVVVGAIALFGITVNPAILLIDRMQRKTIDAGWSAGAAAFSAVRERTRPVLLTAATTIAALLPLTISKGVPNEVWPGFAVTIIGGLISSAILTLLVIPVGYILIKKLDLLFGRVGPWLMVGWIAVVTAIMSAFIFTDVLESLFWIFVVTLLVMGTTLAAIVLGFRREEVPSPHMEDGLTSLEVSHLHKVYGASGPLRATLTERKDFLRRVLEMGGRLYDRTQTVERVAVFVLVSVAFAGWGYIVDHGFWTLICWLLAACSLGLLMSELSRISGKVDRLGNVQLRWYQTTIAYALPWISLSCYFYYICLAPYLRGTDESLHFVMPTIGGLVVMLLQLIRWNAVRQVRGGLQERATGFLRYPRTLWRSLTRRIGGMDLPSREFKALTSFHFAAKKGMIGLLGPNGAGKTTLIRQLAGILDPSLGVVKIGGIPINKIRKHLARWIGYLPQDAGLPDRQTPVEYLSYYAALYELPVDIREERVEMLLNEVGLTEKAEDPIGSLSGGMRQRVAVARTLLRLPPIIIVDEPTVGLDPRERIRFRNLLARLAEDRIVIFSTHVVDDVAVACERVLVLARGTLRFDDSPRNLASLAEGKVWETMDSEETPAALTDTSILASEVPAGNGMVRRRILAERPPSDDSRALNPTAEDGYLWLIGPREAIA